MSTLPLPDTGTDPVEVSLHVTSTAWRRARNLITGRIGYAFGDQLVYSFGNMVIAALVSRHSEARAFGVYILTQRGMDVFIQLSNVVLWAPFTFNLPSTPEDGRSRYRASMLLLQAFACVLFTLVLVFFTRWPHANGEGDLHATVLALSAASGGILFREFTRRMYFAEMRFREAFWTDVVTVGLQIGAVEWLYLAGRLSIPNTLNVLCAGATLVSLWWLLRDARRLRPDLLGTWHDLRRNLQLGRWFLGSNMVFMASSQCNPWVLGATLGGASVGAYAVCESVVNIPRVALTSMQNVMGPMIAEAQAKEGATGVRRTVRRLDRTLLLGSSIFGLLIWLAGPLTAQLIFRRTPGDARSVLGLLSLNLVVYAGALAQSYGLTALGRADTTLYANALGLLVQIAICLGLVRSMGVFGAALALLVGNAVVLAARHWYYRREMAAV